MVISGIATVTPDQAIDTLNRSAAAAQQFEHEVDRLINKPNIFNKLEPIKALNIKI